MCLPLDRGLCSSSKEVAGPRFSVFGDPASESNVSALLITIGYFATQFAVAFCVFGRIVRSYTE